METDHLIEKRTQRLKWLLLLKLNETLKAFSAVLLAFIINRALYVPIGVQLYRITISQTSSPCRLQKSIVSWSVWRHRRKKCAHWSLWTNCEPPTCWLWGRAMRLCFGWCTTEPAPPMTRRWKTSAFNTSTSANLEEEDAKMNGFLSNVPTYIA